MCLCILDEEEFEETEFGERIIRLISCSAEMKMALWVEEDRSIFQIVYRIYAGMVERFFQEC